MSSPSVPTKVLISGTSGYIGGSVLATFLQNNDPTLNNLKFTALIRNQAQADVFKAQGVEPYIFTDLDSSDELTKAASEHDIVIHNANGFHPESAKALIRGLAQRKKATGREDLYYIHTSGTSNLADQPISGKYIDKNIFSDLKDNVYEYMKKREAEQQWPQRTTDLGIVETGKELGIKTYILTSGTIFGQGKGHFHANSIQIPLLMNLALKQDPKQAIVIGEGNDKWDRVHIEDVSRLYLLLVSKLLSASGNEVPHGEKGIFFASGGTFSWGDLSAKIGKIGRELGFLDTDEVKKLNLEQASEYFPNQLFPELAFGSHALSRADYATSVLGWKPEKSGEKEWEQDLTYEWALVGKAAGRE